MKTPQPRGAGGRFVPRLSPVQKYVEQFSANDGMLKLRGKTGEFTIIRRMHPTLRDIAYTKPNPCLVFYNPDPGTEKHEGNIFWHPSYRSELYGGQLNFQPYLTSQWYGAGDPRPTKEAFCAMVVVAILNETDNLAGLTCGHIINSGGR